MWKSEEKDLETGGLPPPRVQDVLSRSTASTVATIGQTEEDESISPTPSTRKASKRERTGNNDETTNRTLINQSFPKNYSVTILIFGILILVLISSTVLVCSDKDKDKTQVPTLEMEPSMESSTMETFGKSDSSTPFWNPIFDLFVTYDPNNTSYYTLQDDKRECRPDILTTTDNMEPILSDWTGVQPTAGSTSIMGILPHIQMSEGSFLSMNKKCNIELSPDHSWTLSFAGARLKTDGVDILFWGTKDDQQNSTIAVCYREDNSIGIGDCSTASESNNSNNDYDDEKDNATLIVPLLHPATDFHVLTMTYNSEERRLQIYQNTLLLGDLNFFFEHEGSVTFSRIGPPHSNDPSRIPSSLALRHLAYLEKHVQDGNIVEISDLTLHMSL